MAGTGTGSCVCEIIRLCALSEGLGCRGVSKLEALIGGTGDEKLSVTLQLTGSPGERFRISFPGKTAHPNGGISLSLRNRAEA